MKNINRNIRIVAEPNGMDGFEVFIDFSGSREYLMSHRYNSFLYNMLKKGASLEEIKRWRPNESYKNTYRSKRSCLSMKAQRAVKYLLSEVEDYMLRREEEHMEAVLPYIETENGWTDPWDEIMAS